MRNLMLIVIGALIGAVVFHLYYLQLDPPARCGWDHPIDGSRRAACREIATEPAVHGYAVKARRDLDSLIGQVSH